MSIALDTAILDLIQNNLLRKDVMTALRPVQMFRALCPVRETWNARVGTDEIITRRGLLGINTKPRKPGVDPSPQAKHGLEQWRVTCDPYNDTTDTNLPTSYTEIQNEVLADARAMMIQAGTTLDHIVRNKMYNTYLGGNTKALSSSAGTAVSVETINGFKETLAADGRMAPVSPANLMEVSIGGVKRFVSAAAPTDPTQPDGAGVLTITVALAVNANDSVLATKRPLIYRVGGGSTYEALTTSNIVTFDDFRQVVVALRLNNVPVFPDGTYHAQIDPKTEAQLMKDAEFQRMLTGTPEMAEWRQFYIGVAGGITFFRNNNVPNAYNTTADDFIAATYVNTAGVEVHRPIVYGQGMIMEKHVPLDQMYKEAAAIPGYQAAAAVITEFNISQDQSTADLSLDGIKYIIRGPVDRLQENVAQTWSFKGGWACPVDSLTGTVSLYKRGMVVEHAG